MFFWKRARYLPFITNLRSIYQFQQRSMSNSVRYLGAEEAAEIDKELMGPKQGFATEQLVELAGLSVSHAVVRFMTTTKKNPKPFGEGRLLCVAGPGLNGADGITASRHLKHFGYHVHVVYPKATDKQMINNLLLQCKQMKIQVTETLPEDFDQYDLVIDAIFGFSFRGDTIRAPFDSIIEKIDNSKIRIVAVDIPSGWDVEKGKSGPCKQKIHHPDCLVSLTVPKLCAKDFDGEMHILGGRFVPIEMADRFKLNIPKYPGTDIITML